LLHDASQLQRDQLPMPATILFIEATTTLKGPDIDMEQQHEQFVERFIRSQERIYAYVATLLPNRTDAEEVFQQTCLILWKKWREFDPARDFVRWACGIAYLEVRNALRKQRSAGRVGLSEELLADLAQTRLESHDLLEGRRLALAECLERLDPSKRALLERCYAGKDDIKHIAAEVGKTANGLYLILKRLRRALFECINRLLETQGAT
jgi:RNA polymerase sigma-70 factor (ECF subfamily)